LFNQIDTDQSGKIEYSEFITAGFDKSLLHSYQNVVDVFNMLKDEERGVVTKEKLIEAFKNCDVGFSEDVIKQFDED